MRFLNPATMPAPFGYSQVVETGPGRTIHLAGQVAMNLAGEIVGRGDFGAQSEQVFANIAAGLKACGASFGDVVKLTIYVTDISQMTAFRSVRDRYVNTERPPASTLVQVAGLVLEGLLLEIDVVAVVEAPAPG
ncbi:MAG TPA: RidA family protein [Kofleriaceae bacterium]|nr:RidA family protein [Kofleriaceae bacterium]